MTKPLIEVNELAAILDDPKTVLLDVSDYSNISEIDKPILSIPNAKRVDIKYDLSDRNSDLPNMMLGTENFEMVARKLGINNTHRVIVFDNKGLHYSPRVWYILRSMGHQDVSCLNGGLPAWEAGGHKLTPIDNTAVAYGDFSAKLQDGSFVNVDQVIENLKTKESLLIDARSKGRFNGTAPEPRAGLTSGHIPCSINIPYTDVLENGFLKSQDDLMKAFKRKAIEDQELVFTCGSGLTACIILLAATQVVDNKLTVYDGSWTEWASHPKTPIMFTQKS